MKYTYYTRAKFYFYFYFLLLLLFLVCIHTTTHPFTLVLLSLIKYIEPGILLCAAK